MPRLARIANRQPPASPLVSAPATPGQIAPPQSHAPHATPTRLRLPGRRAPPRPRANIGIGDALTNPELLGPDFHGQSWDRWKAVLKAAFGEPLTAGEEVLFREVADRDPPAHRVKELAAIVGRGGGKDSAASAIAVQIAVKFDPRGILRPGEKAFVMCIACDRTQAAIAIGYIRGFFETIPVLSRLVADMRDDRVELSNGVIIQVTTNNFRAPRGRRIICAILDEVAFYRDENSASPDIEVHGAITPGLARTPGSMLILISSAHKRSGLLYQRWKDFYGSADPDILVVRGTTLQFNPSADAATIAKDIARDPQLYSAEYNSEWRDDLATFIARELLDAAVDRGVIVRPPSADFTYLAFADPSGGVGDSFTLAIAHAEGDVALLDLLYERRAPFNPTEVVQEVVDILAQYRLSQVTGDRYAAQWVVEAFQKHGTTYTASERDRSAIYLDCLPLFAAGRTRLLDNARLVSQFAALERRTFSTGRDRVDHPASGNSHDDLCNAAAGAIVLAAASPNGLALWTALGAQAGGSLSGSSMPGSAIMYAANRRL